MSIKLSELERGASMYGMIHKAAREFVSRNISEETWLKIAAEAGLDDEHFISGQHYPDEITNAMIGAIVNVTGIPVEDVFDQFGQYWVRYTATTSYNAALEMAGRDFVTFIQNLDNLHNSIKATMPEADLPSFQVINSALDDSRWIVSAGVPGIAATDPPGAFQSTAKRTVFFDGLDHVGATGGTKAAIGSE